MDQGAVENNNISLFNPPYTVHRSKDLWLAHWTHLCSEHPFTRLLQVCMFVHVNPETASSGETLSTLYFAQRAGSVTLGGAKVNMESGEVEILSKNLKKVPCPK
jgi:hypothetical protein